jgi:hypothetical protein
LTLPLIRKIKNLCDSIETHSIFDSDLKSQRISKSIDIPYTQARTCRHCKAPVIVEVTTTIYILDYYIENQKVRHRHPADLETVEEVLESIATEKRLLEDFDPNDYIYLDGGGDRN